MVFENRHEAGKLLASEIIRYKESQPIILALPRGGVEVGFEVAKILQAPLDVLVTRKIGSLNDPEFGIGAISEGNEQILNESTVNFLRIPKKDLEQAIEKEQKELNRRVAIYREGRPIPSLENRTVILVDDGVATGVTARAAIASIRKQKPKQVILASPVCAYNAVREFQHLADRVICLTTPADFSAVGIWYRSFEQVTDEKVVKLLRQSRKYG
jgi:putative phosphoribosyl transferase